MEKTYQPETIESSWYKQWEKSGYFEPNSSKKPSYSIVIPPPNVTGRLHMGHGFQHTLMDILIRYQRMLGKNVLWQVGTDHAGIATQMIVERQLLAEGTSRHEIGRDAFMEKVHTWKEFSGNTITQQIRRLGASVDWQRERFTMDSAFSEAVLHSFVQLHREGYIYKGKKLVNWDPTLQTAISDLEVVTQEEKGNLWHIHYPIVNSDKYLTVATTRPETIFGDVAVAVHPEDPRYKDLIGELVELPLTKRIIPIVADQDVTPEFGTGCVKITPAHDFNDYAIAQRHNLPLINILTPTAHLNENTPDEYHGLTSQEARKKVIAALQQSELLEKTEPYSVKVPRGDRSNAVIEPYLTDQWFVKMKSLAEPAIKAVQEEKIQFVPENWTKTYYQWLENIEDWCISRQLWWGHRIPAWYDEHGQCYVGHNEAEVRKHYQLSDDLSLKQDEDVLDTWFSSALWPFATLGWPDNAEELSQFYPTSVLVTGFDIIFFWVARMIMFGLKFTGEVPFKKVYVTGLIRDAQGQKMSKSKGNILDPIDLIDGITLPELLEKRTQGLMQPKQKESIKAATLREFPEGIPAFGTDALRFTFCALANTGRDIRFDLNRLNGYRNFCNKLWNASRYVLMATENKTIAAESIDYSLADRWILSRLQITINNVTEHLNQYRFDLLAQTIHDFIWHEYCDWYVECTKPFLNKEIATKESIAAQHTLIHVLETSLRILHPIMPFITEEIWQRVKPLTQKNGDTLMLEAFPEYDEKLVDQKALETMEWLQALISAIRSIRSEMNIAPGKALPISLKNFSDEEKLTLTHYQTLFTTLAKVDSIHWATADEQLPPSATQRINSIEIHIPLANLINKEDELNRLKKELTKIEKEIEQAKQKLDNRGFMEKAPANVVEKVRQELKQWEDKYHQFKEQLTRISEL